MLLTLLGSRLAPYRPNLLAVVGFQLVSVLSMLYLPSLNADIIDRGIAAGDTGYILHTGALMLAMREAGCDVRGIEIDAGCVERCVSQGLSVVQGDADRGQSARHAGRGAEHDDRDDDDGDRLHDAAAHRRQRPVRHRPVADRHGAGALQWPAPCLPVQQFALRGQLLRGGGGH